MLVRPLLLAAIAITASLAFALVVLLEPWPVSLRQGPDTTYAKEAFERQLGDPPGLGITEVYAREEWGFGGDGIVSIRFHYRDDAFPEELRAALALEPLDTEARAIARVLAGPGWWPSAAVLRGLRDAWGRAGVETLWVDRGARLAYFQRANF